MVNLWNLPYDYFCYSFSVNSELLSKNNNKKNRLNPLKDAVNKSELSSKSIQ
jgi:hypothetical protein